MLHALVASDDTLTCGLVLFVEACRAAVKVAEPANVGLLDPTAAQIAAAAGPHWHKVEAMRVKLRDQKALLLGAKHYETLRKERLEVDHGERAEEDGGLDQAGEWGAAPNCSRNQCT